MLDRIEPRQLDEWIAWRKIEPDPLDKLVKILSLGFAAVVCTWGGKAKPEYFTPWVDEQVQEVSPNEGAALFARAYGAE